MPLELIQDWIVLVMNGKVHLLVSSFSFSHHDFLIRQE